MSDGDSYIPPSEGAQRGFLLGRERAPWIVRELLRQTMESEQGEDVVFTSQDIDAFVIAAAYVCASLRSCASVMSGSFQGGSPELAETIERAFDEMVSGMATEAREASLAKATRYMRKGRRGG